MQAAVRDQVRQRANDCCEYCRLPQSAAPIFRFHIEHIVAQQHGGGDDMENLALACPDCNAHKGPNLSSIDPETGQTIELFSPRRHKWNEHFSLHGAMIQALTPIGRATVRLLRMNDESRVKMRGELVAAGLLADVD